MRFFRDSISSGKTAPSLFLHKQLDVTSKHPSVTTEAEWSTLP